jgi:hypothetical protein
MKNEGQTPERAEDSVFMFRVLEEEYDGEGNRIIKKIDPVSLSYPRSRMRREDPQSSDKSSERTNPDQESR